MTPEMQKAGKKRMVGSTMICLLYLTRASTVPSFTEQVALFLYVSYPDYPIMGIVCKKYDRREIMRSEEAQRTQRQAKLLAAIERKIAYKNIEFIIQHQNDTKDELAIYLKACMDDIGHAPAKMEVIGGDYIEYRFGSWEKALGIIYSGPLSTIKYPPAFKDRKIVQDMLRQALEQYRSTHPQKGVQ